ncbi:MAG TPA: Do family serine endopeptidase [Acidobacteriaceae bacterium]|nr:Do family serine endopeptidase [Acidobacteriaceae bacterium]
MSLSTKSLVTGAGRYVAPAVLSAAVAVGAVALVNHNAVHASAVTASPLDDHSVAALTALDSAMEAVAARVTPAVVNIAVTSRPSMDEVQQQGGGEGQMQGLPPGLQQFFGPGGPLGGFGGGRMQPQQPQLEHGIGSGVIISPDGYIVTNDHVVDGAKDIKVTLHDRRVLNGRVVGVDKLTDLAVVKVNAHDLPAISWGDSSKLEPGETVLAFGSPFGYFQFSVTRGIVSAVNRPNPYSDNARKPGGYIQTDAAINPGNSGGPLVNAHGELVGINTFIISNSGSFAGAGFAIPSQMARAISTQLIEHGKVEHGYVGIAMNDVTPDNARFFNLQDASGAIVAQVTPDSPASRAGLKQGDVITTLNGQRIANSSALQVAVSELAPGTSISLGVLRDGKPTTIDVKIGTYGGDHQEVADNDGEGGSQTGKLGLAVGDLTQDVRQQLQVPDNVHGAVVENVRPASPADDAGLQPGDVILQVNRKPTGSANQFASQIHQDTNSSDLLLLVWSKGNASYRTVHSDGGQNG